MLPQEIIRKKRDGGSLNRGEISDFMNGLASREVTESQAAALAMAIFFKGMTPDETIALTVAMRDSGTTLSWKDLDGPVIDKHSTGGIGDKISLVLAPLIAALGGYVPMISGRGLGHTGGTLDKLESIPGYSTRQDVDGLKKAVHAAGCAIVGQTADLAPADGRLYAIRDVTATVDCQPLIVASILSKKLAAGLGGLVMDVKVGSGAFLPSVEQARALAHDLVRVSVGAGLPCHALLTDMNQCLGWTAGNALEVGEAIEFLTGGRREPRLHAVTIGLAARLAVLGGLVDTVEQARSALERALDDGRAADRFQRMVASLGGPSDLLEHPARYLAEAPVRRSVTLDREGVVAAIDARALGLAIIELGGGRRRPEDRVDHRVGLSQVLGIGDRVTKDRPFAHVHAASDATAERAINAIRAAVTMRGSLDISGMSPLLEDIGSIAEDRPLA